MKLDSELFDRIRVKPDADRTARRAAPRCEAVGCVEPGQHRAPKGRDHEGEYFCFCLDHVRDYNKSYNYFAGMSDTDVTDYIKRASTGHRPTWAMGVNGWAHGSHSAADGAAPGSEHFRFQDPLGVFGDEAQPFSEAKLREERIVRNAERRSLEALGLDAGAASAEIKTKFKLLVKRYHPDLNGGDRSTEDRLREIIQAYNHLKAAGLC